VLSELTTILIGQLLSLVVVCSILIGQLLSEPVVCSILIGQLLSAAVVCSILIGRDVVVDDGKVKAGCGQTMAPMPEKIAKFNKNYVTSAV
jgi:hypothetical protein